MSITITVGKAGRIVVPKVMRDRLHLREGSRLRVEVVADKLEFTPEADAVQIVKRGKRRVVIGWKGFDAVNEMREEYISSLERQRQNGTSRIRSLGTIESHEVSRRFSS